MTKATLLAIAAFAGAIATTANKLAGETVPEEPTAAELPQPTTRRGRGPAKTEPPPEPEKEKPAAGATAAGGKPESELRELIQPLVDAGRGAEVKKLITKHGGTRLSDLPAAAHAAFIRDIEGLTI